MVLRKFIFLSLLGILALGVSLTASAFDARQMDWRGLTDDFKMEKGGFRGTWQKSEEWSGTLCDGYYWYDNTLTGKISDLDPEIQTDGSILMTAQLEEIRGRVSGTYRSQLTACAPLGGAYGASIDWATLHGLVTFVDVPGRATPQVRVRIYDTRLGRIRLASGLPDFLEQTVTRGVNEALSRIWASYLGDYISSKISEFLKDRFPRQRD